MEKEINTFNYSKVDKKADKLIKIVKEYMSEVSPEYIDRELQTAYKFAKKAHHWVFRHSGDPYIIHPVEATIILTDLRPDITTLQASLLHDVIEDTDYTYENIKDNFGVEVADICAGMEKVSKVKYKWEDRNIGSLRKMFVAMAEDIRVIFVKLADRIHNMRTLKYHPKKEKRKRIALETLNIYVPIADRLWLFSFKNSLEEECFKILEPIEYRDIKKQLFKLGSTKKSFIENARKEIDRVLKVSNLLYQIDFRVKSVFSIYKKLKKKWLDTVEELHDIFWVRIIVDDNSSCYKILWLIHSNWVPIPNKFKDYIALPKPNWYQSLHTTVIWLLKDYIRQPTEIQIRTIDMHKHAEIWVAAHFEYKEKWSKIAKDIDWVKDLKEMTKNLENEDFMDTLKLDIFKDRIFVFTPKGDSKNLPAGSTPIDFAYDIHSDIGNHISIAKVNGQVSPLDRELKNGDVVEIIIDKVRKPNPFWISFVKTSKAKNSIKIYLKKENKDDHRERWRDMINKYLEKIWLPHLDKDLSLFKVVDSREYSVESRAQFLEQVGNFSHTPSAVVRRAIKINNSKINSIKNKIQSKKEDTKQDNKKEIIYIWWEKDIPHNIAKCCNPVRWEKIVAHINSKWILSIHERDCHTLRTVNPDRLISSHWDWEEENYLESVLYLELRNKIGTLSVITDLIAKMQIDILEIHSKKNKETWFIDLEMVLEYIDYDYLVVDRLVDKIKSNLAWRIIKIELKTHNS